MASEKMLSVPDAYRADIDGLRAIAVLSVIVFHVNASYLPGGFLGVDVFLVISGYLISLLLMKEIDNRGRIDFLAFYQRRIKRLFPALVFTIYLTLAAGLIFLTPADYLNLMSSSVWATFFSANFHFLLTLDTGYFAADSREMPLLHLWSLGVEEQFYLLWPFVLMLLLNKLTSGAVRIIVLVALISVSLVLAQSLLKNAPMFAYFMLPTRAWELLIGALVALLSSRGNYFPRHWMSEAVSLLGFAMLAVSLMLVTEDAGVPGIAAAPAVIGTALMLMVAPATWIGKMLSIRALRIIGVLSYSGYLVHWPLLAFARYSLLDITLWLGLGFIGLTFAIAAFCYHYIEKPLRHCSVSRLRTCLFYFLLPAVLLLLYVAYMTRAIHSGAPLLEAFSQYQQIYLPGSRAGISSSCLASHFSNEQLEEERCVIPYQSTPTVLLAGDSNANHFLGMMSVLADHYKFSFRNISRQECLMLFYGDSLGSPAFDQDNCVLFRDAIKRHYSAYTTVILGADWERYYRRDPEHFPVYLQQTIDELANSGKTVILMAKIPTIEGYRFECWQRRQQLNALDCESRFSDVVSPPTEVNALLREVASRHQNVSVVDIRDVLCKAERCSAYLDGVPVYLDSNHLNQTGSALIGNQLIKQQDSQLKIFQLIGTNTSHSK